MIYVFKTSVKTKSQVKTLQPQINKLLHAERWNFDLTDCDKILRIDSEEEIVIKIKDILSLYKIHCEELV